MGEEGVEVGSEGRRGAGGRQRGPERRGRRGPGHRRAGPAARHPAVGEDHHEIRLRGGPGGRDPALLRSDSHRSQPALRSEALMPLPYYVSPEQMMKDKAEYARKGISRGKAIVTIEYRDGALLGAENPSTLLHKISEIYDRIPFPGPGKHNETDNLREPAR